MTAAEIIHAAQEKLLEQTDWRSNVETTVEMIQRLNDLASPVGRQQAALDTMSLWQMLLGAYEDAVELGDTDARTSYSGLSAEELNDFVSQLLAKAPFPELRLYSVQHRGELAGLEHILSPIAVWYDSEPVTVQHSQRYPDADLGDPSLYPELAAKVFDRFRHLAAWPAWPSGPSLS